MAAHLTGDRHSGPFQFIPDATRRLDLLEGQFRRSVQFLVEGFQ